jgi:hypothetical protein
MMNRDRKLFKKVKIIFKTTSRILKATESKSGEKCVDRLPKQRSRKDLTPFLDPFSRR